VSRTRLTGFIDGRGAWRELRDPDGPPTARQLVALHRAGALTLAVPGTGVRFSKGRAAVAIDEAVAVGLLELRRPADPAERRHRVCRELVEHVRANPGCTTTGAVRSVRARRAYAGDRVRDLLTLGVLVDRAALSGPGRARELHVNDAGHEPAERSTR
jgi:hypothetical protein